MKTTSVFEDIVFYAFLFLVIAGIVFFAYTGIKSIKKESSVQRWCALEGYALSEVRDGRVYCINHTSEPSILLLGDYEELAQEME